MVKWCFGISEGVAASVFRKATSGSQGASERSYTFYSATVCNYTVSASSCPAACQVPGDAYFLTDKASVIRHEKKDTSCINQTSELHDVSDNTFTKSCRPHVRAVSWDSKNCTTEVRIPGGTEIWLNDIEFLDLFIVVW